MKRPRNLGIDGLRSLSMLMVICYHVLSQGSILDAVGLGGGTKHYVLSLLKILCFCAVNVYGITTGYMLSDSRFRLSRIVKLWATTVFWGVAVSCVFFVTDPETRSVKELISACLPLLRGRYWFFSAYFVVYMVSPALNHLIRTLPRQTFRLLFAALFVIFGIIPVGALGNDVLRISGGHHMVWLLALYLIGGYIRRYGLPKLRHHTWYLGGYFLFALVHLLFKITVELVELKLFGSASHGDIFLLYTSPLVVGEAVCLFAYFANAFTGLKPQGTAAKLIGFVTPGVFSVYLIHVHPLVFWNIIVGGFTNWAEWPLLQTIGAVLGFSVLLFTACILLDALRQRLFTWCRIDALMDAASSKVETTVRNRIKG